MILNNSTTGSYPRPRNGSVLILTLWTLALLSALAVASATQLTALLRLARFLDNDVQASLAARAGVEQALLAAVRATNRWDVTLADNTADGIAVGSHGRMRLVHYPGNATPAGAGGTARASASAGIIGEESRITLNFRTQRHRNLLAALLRLENDVSADLARDWVNCLAATRYQLIEGHENTGVDVETVFGHNNYLFDRLIEPRGFRSWHEVIHGAERTAREEGIDWDMMRKALIKIRPYSTLYGNGKLNVNSAGIVPLTAAAMATGADVAQARAIAENIVAYRQDAAFFEKLEDVRNAAPDLPAGMTGFLTVRSTCFGGTAEGWLDTAGARDNPFDRTQPHAAPHMTRLIDFVVQGNPPGVLYWHEY